MYIHEINDLFTIILAMIRSEAKRGHCRKVEVIFNGKALEISHDGPGLNPKIPKDTTFYKVLTTLFIRQGKKPIYNLVICNALSAEFVFITQGKALHFAQGILQSTFPSDQLGATYFLRPDPIIFAEKTLDANLIKKRLLRLSKDYPKIQISYNKTPF